MDYERLAGQTHVALESLCAKVADKHGIDKLLKGNDVYFDSTQDKLPAGVVIIKTKDKFDVQVDNISLVSTSEDYIALKVFCMFIRIFNLSANFKGKIG